MGGEFLPGRQIAFSVLLVWGDRVLLTPFCEVERRALGIDPMAVLRHE